MIRLSRNLKEGSRFFCGAAEGQAAVRTFFSGNPGESRTVRSRPAQTSEPFVVFLGGVAAFGPGGAGPEFAPHKKARSSLPRFLCC
jgi:hypothetical protein